MSPHLGQPAGGFAPDRRLAEPAASYLSSSALIFAFDVRNIWQQVSDSVYRAVTCDQNVMVWFACLAVILGLFLLVWRK